MSLPDLAFETIAGVARLEAGLHIEPAKSAMVEARVRRRLRALGLARVEDYCALVAGTSDEATRERRALVNAMTTNVTGFFRERHHFDLLAQHVAARLRDAPPRTVSIWSAGGSDGSEAVSAVLAVAEHAGDDAALRLRVLVTDVDDGAIAAATTGAYRLASLDGADLHRHAGRIVGGGEGAFSLRPDLRASIEVRHHNLVRAQAPGSGFDAILCRNVLIYFDDATKRTVQETLIASLRPGGLLFLGHSERLVADAAGYDEMRRVGVTAFRRELTGRQDACR